eukprot:tig00000451_g978.t1
MGDVTALAVALAASMSAARDRRRLHLHDGGGGGGSARPSLRSHSFLGGAPAGTRSGRPSRLSLQAWRLPIGEEPELEAADPGQLAAGRRGDTSFRFSIRDVMRQASMLQFQPRPSREAAAAAAVHSRLGPAPASARSAAAGSSARRRLYLQSGAGAGADASGEDETELAARAAPAGAGDSDAEEAVLPIATPRFQGKLPSGTGWDEELSVRGGRLRISSRRRRLYLLFAAVRLVLTLALIVTGALNMSGEFRNLERARDIEGFVGNVEATLSLVDGLQRERGWSGVVLGTRALDEAQLGQRTERLAELRRDSDRRAAEWLALGLDPQALASARGSRRARARQSFPGSAAEILSRVSPILRSALPGHRGAVDRRSVTTLDNLLFYNLIIDDILRGRNLEGNPDLRPGAAARAEILRVVSLLVERCPDRNVLRGVVSLSSLAYEIVSLSSLAYEIVSLSSLAYVRMQEHMGRQRAAISSALSRGCFCGIERELYDHAVVSRGVEEAHRDQFRLFATPEELQTYASAVRGPDVDLALRLRAEVLAVGPGAPLPSADTPELWFDSQTGYMDRVASVTRTMLVHVVGAANEATRKSWQQFAFALIGGTASLLGALYILYHARRAWKQATDEGVGIWPWAAPVPTSTTPCSPAATAAAAGAAGAAESPAAARQRSNSLPTPTPRPTAPPLAPSTTANPVGIRSACTCNACGCACGSSRGTDLDPDDGSGSGRGARGPGRDAVRAVGLDRIREAAEHSARDDILVVDFDRADADPPAAAPDAGAAAAPAASECTPTPAPGRAALDLST